MEVAPQHTQKLQVGGRIQLWKVVQLKHLGVLIISGSQIEGIGVSPRSEVDIKNFFFSFLLHNRERLKQNVVCETALFSKISRENLIGVEVYWEASLKGVERSAAPSFFYAAHNFPENHIFDAF